MRVIGDKLDEAHKFKWDTKETLMNLLVDYRSTPHTTTNVSPFEAMYGRKMRVKLSNFHPEEEDTPTEGIIDRSYVEKKQRKMKQNHDVKARAALPTMKVGERIRVKKENGSFADWKKIVEVSRNSVKLSDGKVWPLNRVSITRWKNPEEKPNRV